MHDHRMDRHPVVQVVGDPAAAVAAAAVVGSPPNTRAQPPCLNVTRIMARTSYYSGNPHHSISIGPVIPPLL